MKFHLTGGEFSCASELAEFGIELSPQGIETKITAGDALTIARTESGIEIGYAKRVQVFYALKRLADGLPCGVFSPTFENLTYMCDCSRNAVPKTETLKSLIRHLAVMGYDSLGLYMEDTFRVEKYPYFGYLRTPYSREDLEELDRYARQFGVELTPYIQTLAHFNTLTRHYAMENLFDTGDILLVGEERTYVFLEELIKTCAETFSGRSINIGMDEAYMLGRGQYQDLHGARPRFDIMAEHLARVVKICEKYGLAPMMWSDMFFSQTIGAQYGESLSPELAARLPASVELIYWDYGNTDEAHYRENLRRHRVFRNPIGFAGGACKWHGFTPDNRNSFRSCLPSVRACAAEGIKRYIVTGWGDNGAECSLFAILPTLHYCSRLNYGFFEEDEEMKKSFLTLAGMPFDDFMKVDLNNRVTDGDGIEGRNTANKYLLFNDILLGTLDTTVPEGLGARYARHALQLKEAVRVAGKWKYLFRTQYRLAEALSIKADLGVRLRRAYREGDREELKRLLSSTETLARDVRAFYRALREQWEKENRANGFDVQDIRIGALLQRVQATVYKLKNYLGGKAEAIPELNEKLLDHMGGGENFEVDPDQCEWRWRRMTSVNVNE